MCSPLEHIVNMAALPIGEPFVTVEEYLHAVCKPDCDYVDGRVEERTLGERDHGRLQLMLAALFAINEADWHIWAAA